MRRGALVMAIGGALACQGSDPPVTHDPTCVRAESAMVIEHPGEWPLPEAVLAHSDGRRSLYWTGASEASRDLEHARGTWQLVTGDDLPLHVEPLAEGTSTITARASTGDGGLVLAGAVEGDVWLELGERWRVPPGGALLVARLGADGRVVWSRTLDAGWSASLAGLLVLPDDSLVLAYGASGYPGLGLPESGVRGATYGVVARLDADGELRWAQLFGRTEQSWVDAITVDPVEGTVTVGGTIGGGDVAAFGLEGTVVFDPLGPEAVLLQLDLDGRARWATRVTGGPVDVQQVTPGPDGSVVAAGDFSSVVVFAADQASERAVTSLNAQRGDLWLARFDRAGELDWVTRTEPSSALVVAPNTRSVGAWVFGDEILWVGEYSAGLQLDDAHRFDWAPEFAGGHVFAARYDLDGELRCATGALAHSPGYLAVHAWAAGPLPGEDRLAMVSVGDRGIEAPPEIALSPPQGRDRFLVEWVVSLPPREAP